MKAHGPKMYLVYTKLVGDKTHVCFHPLISIYFFHFHLHIFANFTIKGGTPL